MHVAQLLYPLFRSPYIEVVEAFLPDRSDEGTPPSQQASEALLNHLHHYGWIVPLEFGHQKVEVLRHDHVTDHHEAISLPRCFEHTKKEIAPLRRAQSRLAVITTAGDEVKVLLAVITVEALGHWFRVGNLSGQVRDE